MPRGGQAALRFAAGRNPTAYRETPGNMVSARRPILLITPAIQACAAAAGRQSRDFGLFLRAAGAAHARFFPASTSGPGRGTHRARDVSAPLSNG